MEKSWIKEKKYEHAAVSCKVKGKMKRAEVGLCSLLLHQEHAEDDTQERLISNDFGVHDLGHESKTRAK